MTTSSRWRPIGPAIFLGLACLGRATTTFAEEGAATSGLAEAERAYQEIDFATMHDRATSALAAGRATRDETTRLNVLVGISAAALGENDEAKRAFIVALGVDPTLKLDRTLSPKIREPYLEALGFWGAYPERLALRVKAAEDGEHLSVELVDPAHLARKIAIHIRPLGSRAFQPHAADAGRAVRFPLPSDARSRGYEYYSTTVDEHENVLAEAGSEADPRMIHAAQGEAAKAGTPVAPQRSYLLPVVLGATGLAAAGAGVAFQLARESAAREWNGTNCEQPGSSRGEQCADVDSRRRFYEAMAIGAYTAAGLLLTSSAIVLIVGEPSAKERGGAAPHAGLIGCGLAGPALSCAGRF